MSKSQDEVNDSFLYPEREQKGVMKWLQKFDFFSFIPVPKDEPVSTRRSIIGSCIFIVLFLIYIGIDLYQFISDNPPIVENAQMMLDDEFHTLPRTAIAFMAGEYLNETRDFSREITFEMTKELKDNSVKLSTPIPLATNNASYLSDWLGNTTNFYTRLETPSEQMQARGLLYSTQNSNYTKLTIRLCNVSNPEVDCEKIENITSLMAKGRVFLFIEETEDDSGVERKQTKPSRFRIANFFLIPKLYKRVIVEFQVVKTTVLPDYFHHFTTREFTRLELYSIAEQTSDTSINDEEKKRYPLEMLGITFQLASQVLSVRVTYTTFLDHVAKWGAFFNVLFAVFAIFFLAYNKNKFYQKNPDWDRFKNRKKSGNMLDSETKGQEEQVHFT